MADQLFVVKVNGVPVDAPCSEEEASTKANEWAQSTGSSITVTVEPYQGQQIQAA